MSVYDFSVEKPDGSKVSLKDYAGKVLLIVNSATQCGFTPQYDWLEKMHEAYGDKGLAILEFPCNQFKEQAPESDDEITKFCTMKFGVKFPRFKKCDVKGDTAIDLYKYLISQKDFAGFDLAHELTKILKEILEGEDKDYEKKPDIKWNFTKFLVDKGGNVVERFEPTTNLDKVEERIKGLL